MTNTYRHSDSGASSFVSRNIHTYTVITASASNTCLFECLLQAVPKTHQHHRGIWTRASAVNLYLMSCAVLSTAKREYLLLWRLIFHFHSCRSSFDHFLQRFIILSQTLRAKLMGISVNSSSLISDICCALRLVDACSHHRIFHFFLFVQCFFRSESKINGCCSVCGGLNCAPQRIIRNLFSENIFLWLPWLFARSELGTEFTCSKQWIKMLGTSDEYMHWYSWFYTHQRKSIHSSLLVNNVLSSW